VGLPSAIERAFVDEDGVTELNRASFKESADSQNVSLHIFPADDRELLLANVAPAVVRLVLEFGGDFNPVLIVEDREVGAKAASFSFEDGVVVEDPQRQSASLNLAVQRELERPDDVPFHKKRVLAIGFVEPRQSALKDPRSLIRSLSAS